MRVALGNEAQERGHRGDAVERERRRDQPRRAHRLALDREDAEMLVEPRPPHRLDRVPGLQHRREALRAPAMDEPEMAPMRARHQLEDDGRLAMPAGAEHEGFVGPLHGERSSARRRTLSEDVDDAACQEVPGLRAVGRHVRRGGVGLQRLEARPFLDHHERVGAELRLEGRAVGVDRGAYSMQPSSAWTAGMLARKASSTRSRMPGFAVMMARTWIKARSCGRPG